METEPSILDKVDIYLPIYPPQKYQTKDLAHVLVLENVTDPKEDNKVRVFPEGP